MKKLSLLFFLPAFLVLCGCKKDDPQPVYPEGIYLSNYPFLVRTFNLQVESSYTVKDNRLKIRYRDTPHLFDYQELDFDLSVDLDQVRVPYTHVTQRKFIFYTPPSANFSLAPSFNTITIEGIKDKELTASFEARFPYVNQSGKQDSYFVAGTMRVKLDRK